MNIHPAHNTLLLQHSLAVPSVAARVTLTSHSRPSAGTLVKLTQIVIVVLASSTELGVCKATVASAREGKKLLHAWMFTCMGQYMQRKLYLHYQ